MNRYNDYYCIVNQLNLIPFIMKTFAISKTSFLKAYLEQNKFIQYESFEDCYIIYARDETQIFWFGAGYEQFCNEQGKI